MIDAWRDRDVKCAAVLDNCRVCDTWGNIYQVSATPAPEPEPRFRRPTPDDAADLAREMFDAGERIDVFAVARRVGVSRATMHRWFGTRDQLLTAVLERLAEDFVDDAEAAAEGEGDERMLDFTRRIAADSAVFEPLREIAQGEADVALRLLLAADGPVRPKLGAAIRSMVAATRTPAAVRRLDPTIDLFVDAAMSLHWATIATGEQPDPERLVLLGRALLEHAEKPVSLAGRRASRGTG
jgi:AcrR family transcriptional regulator